MAKASGWIRSYSKSKQLVIYQNVDDGGIPELTDNKDLMLRLYNDFKNNKKNGYDISDESWNFVSKTGKFYSASEYEDLPKIKKSEILFMEQYTADGRLAWYNKNVPGYKDIIKKVTAYVVK